MRPADLPTAVIYIKNRVNRSWYQSDQFTSETLIPEDEKARIRDILVPVLASSEGPVRQQLVPVLQRILQCDFPGQWPRFIDFTMELLNTNNPSSVHAGLQCLLALCRAFRYKSTDNHDRQHFDSIVETSFPRLMAICNELVNQESDEAGEMLHLALKAYKHATWVWRPPRRDRPCANVYKAGAVSVPAAAAGQHRLVHRLPSDRCQGGSAKCHAGRSVRPREAPLVEGQEVGLLQPQPPLHQVRARRVWSWSACC